MEDIIKRAIRSNDPGLVNIARSLLLQFKLVLAVNVTDEAREIATKTIEKCIEELTTAIGNEFNG